MSKGLGARIALAVALGFIAGAVLLIWKGNHSAAAITALLGAVTASLAAALGSRAGGDHRS